ncbi:hypothetical protein [Novosphingobium sp. B1]|uniref:hypothetical protein n=1 Tax=Novosphingobium sp. B1 TaxID=1938756 RepID=UPI0009D87ABC|nr:hypothetical protein [Novosphingobium sp. B1]SMD02282.1 hypothetical protein SAMN06272759_12227 [Novosphingobium sp. B1]
MTESNVPGRRSSKPTLYQGINFRSRLEARWAAMFDVLGWTWEYEPETPGAYIPDFLIHGVHGRQMYVEVKSFVDFVQNREAIVAKAEGALGFDVPFLVVTDQFERAIGFEELVLGEIYNAEGEDSKFERDNALIFQPGKQAHGLEFDLAGEFGSWRGLLTGAYDGNGLFEVSLLPKSDLMRMWSRAGNAIQWKPDR